jgi:hypothetical protein
MLGFWWLNLDIEAIPEAEEELPSRTGPTRGLSWAF